MKVLPASAFLFLISLLAFGTVPNTAPNSASTIGAYTHLIGEDVINGGDFCSATAIGPYALLTASHCEMPTNIVQVDGKDAYLFKIIRDTKDHSIYLLSGVKPFAHYAKVTQAAPSLGQEVSLIGNPGEGRSIYRTGHFSGTSKMDDGNKVLLFDYVSCHGDSGSGLFDATGTLYAVQSVMMNIGTEDTAMWMAGAFPLVFTKDQLANAVAFVPPADAPKPPAKSKDDDAIRALFKIIGEAPSDSK